MKKAIIFLSVAMAVSSCSTTSDGAATGALIGGMFGSAIGGLAGNDHVHHYRTRGHFGYHDHAVVHNSGRDAGTVIGMLAGAAVGAAIGNANEKAQTEANKAQQTPYYNNNAPANDIIEMQPSAQASIESKTISHATTAAVQLTGVHFDDQEGDCYLARGEKGECVFELKNVTSTALYNVVPMVTDVTGNKHVYISQPISIECLGPGQTLRYTAMVVADKYVKDGMVQLNISVTQNGENVSDIHSINIPLRKKRQ